MESIDKQLAASREELHSMGATTAPDTSSKTITVGVTATSAGDVALQLVYLVHGASWAPSYDVRISSEENKLSLTYYGRVTNNTGEDWSDMRLSLSTATPSLAGTAPVLPSRSARLAPQYFKQSSHGMQFALADDEGEELEELREQSLSSRAMPPGAPRPPPAPTAGVATSRVEKGAASTTFLIDRVASVPSDNTPKKVTITIQELAATFRFSTSPAVAASAYLQANVVNTSDYTLLPSSSCSVFFDSSFVTTTSMGRVAPTESFRTSLGVDPAVRVSYHTKGVRNSQVGWLSKSAVQTHASVTTVKNTKSIPAVVILREALPRSSDASIKVTPVLPAPTAFLSQEGEVPNSWDDLAFAELDDSTPPAAQTGVCRRGGAADFSRRMRIIKHPVTNHVMFTFELAPQEEITVPFEYTVEAPSGRPVTVTST